MNRLAVIAAGLLLGGSPALAIDSQGPLPDPALQARYETLTNELRCVVCQNQTVADEQIIAFMTDRYGEFVLYRPPLTSRTLVLWAAPALLLLIGLIVVGRIIRRRSLAGDIPEHGEEAFPEPEPRDT